MFLEIEIGKEECMYKYYYAQYPKPQQVKRILLECYLTC